MGQYKNRRIKRNYMSFALQASIGPLALKTVLMDLVHCSPEYTTVLSCLFGFLVLLAVWLPVWLLAIWLLAV